MLHDRDTVKVWDLPPTTPMWGGGGGETPNYFKMYLDYPLQYVPMYVWQLWVIQQLWFGEGVEVEHPLCSGDVFVLGDEGKGRSGCQFVRTS